MGKKKMYRIGVIGLVHDHVWGLIRQFQDSGMAEIVAAWDENPPLLGKISREHGVQKNYPDYMDLLKQEKPDAVLVATENNRKVEIVKAAAKRGIHVMTEKPMAATLKEADTMLKAAERGGITLMVNWPTAWSPAIQMAYDIVKKGTIGRVYQMRYRGAHAGPKEVGCSKYFYEWLYSREKNGGGALIDYCCYGANLCRWFLGRPQSVTGVAGRLVKDYIDVEDNAILLLRYPNAIGIAEASWSQIGDAPTHGPIINGSKGTILVDRKGITLFTKENPEGIRQKPPGPNGG
ncbi:MAG: Gfo/Idh/MocA family protein [bacterium]